MIPCKNRLNYILVIFEYQRNNMMFYNVNIMWFRMALLDITRYLW